MKNDLTGIQEYRDIKITSKRQLTIPKSFYDALRIEEEVQAYLLDDGIYLKPIRSGDSLYQSDVQTIVRKTLEEGFAGEDLAQELAHRINQYDRVLADRVHEFMEDMKADSGSGEDEGDLDFNGLDVFFDEEDGKASESN